MVKEVKRNFWSKFCRQFSSNNQYRWMSVSIADKRNKSDCRIAEYPFMGLALEKKGRLISGIKLFSAWENPDAAAEPILAVNQPVKVVLEKDDDGNDNFLRIHTEDGTETTIKLHGTKDENRQRTVVEKVAYRIYEQRGMDHGGDINDWLQAERKVREAEAMFV